MIERRGFLSAILALGAAPALVHASSLMKAPDNGWYMSAGGLLWPKRYRDDERRCFVFKGGMPHVEADRILDAGGTVDMACYQFIGPSRGYAQIDLTPAGYHPFKRGNSNVLPSFVPV